MARMKINVVIVDESADRGMLAARSMRKGLVGDVIGWEMYCHVRHPDDKIGTDMAYAKYTSEDKFS